MPDAASEALSGNLRIDFEDHLRECAACREEFSRVQALMCAIDEGVSASVAAEPSPQFVAGVRQRIAWQPSRASIWSSRQAWLTAAAACAVLAVFLLAARALRKTPQPLHANVSRPVASPPAYLAPSPNSGGQESVASVPSRPRTLLAAHRVPPRVLRHSATEPQVIIEPGQMREVLQLVAATQRAQIDGANLLNSEKKAAEPLEIKPIVIAPLRISALEDEAERSTSNGGLDSSKSSLSSRSN